jgi:cation transport regulator ChaB
MPYDSADAVPRAVRDRLKSPRVIDAWRKAFNAAYDGTCATNSDREGCAARVAWSAVKNMKSETTREIPLLKGDEEQRLVYGIVYEPDAHEDFMSAEEIVKTAHDFMARYANGVGGTGSDHLFAASRSELPIVESFIAPVDFEVGGQIVRKGSWVLAGKVRDSALWEAVKKGQYTGWSLEGHGLRTRE